ncbi:bidirectional sugar transporter SWEET16-like isoform X1 [Solanum lycopersicum]|uniref:Bidirectional sugar transporter SWEET n=1 Tax=Solanum lycopersicum TaxID=4081 RepID=A0A3Q7F8C1_SOLLC|nr:bidirectional sugar transporter SWEET16-like [Solanum lycopersicum]
MANFSFILGIIGNVISILMFAAPIKTFKRIMKKKSTEDFKGIPYITTLLSTCLWTFYGLLKPGGLLVVTVNGSGAILHIIYVTLFLIYAPEPLKIQSMKLVAIIDIAFLGAVIAITLVAVHGTTRLTLVGFLCAALNIGMYAAPLAATRTVIKMKSVEYMPFFLSFFQFLNGGVWTAYAVLVKDYFIGVPNGIGFILGAAQLILYFMYYKSSPTKSTEEKGSAHLMKREIQMKDVNGAHENENSRNLHKWKSLPKPSLVRQYSEKLVKTLSNTPSSLGSHNVHDIEKGLKEAH